MKAYIDKEFMCHTESAADREEFEIPFFDGKCKEFIESHRFVPEDREWQRDDGKVFRGEILTYGKDSVEVDSAQAEYEKQLLAEYSEALAVLGVEV
jgi:hypothetical protein